MTKDMTNGNPLKLIISFCIPMILGNLLQQLYNMVDAIIVGKCINTNALAAVGSTGSICFLVLGFAIGICSGFCIPVSQAYGAGNQKNMRHLVMNAVYLSVIIGAILTVVTLVYKRKLLQLMDTPDDIIDQADQYLTYIFAGIFVTVFYNLLASILRSLGDSKSPLIFLGISSVINIILDYVFIEFCDMGVGGAGLATIIAQGISTVLCFIYIKKYVDILTFEKDEMTFNLQKSLRLLSIGVPMALQFSITAIGSIILQTAINGFGTIHVAAVTAASKIQLIFAGPMECLGITMATYCGQNRGAGKFDRIKKGLQQSILLSISYCIVAAFIVCIFGKYIAYLFIESDNTTVIDLTVYFLRVNGLCFIALGVLFILRNSLQGLGYSMLPMMAGFSELFARSAVVWFLVAYWDYFAICIASPVAWLAADILLIITLFIKLPKLKAECNAT